MGIIGRRRYLWQVETDQRQIIDSFVRVSNNEKCSFQTTKSSEYLRYSFRKSLFPNSHIVSSRFLGEIRKNSLGVEVKGSFTFALFNGKAYGVLWAIISVLSIAFVLMYFRVIPYEVISIDKSFEWIFLAYPIMWVSLLGIISTVAWLTQKKRRMEILSIIEKAIENVSRKPVQENKRNGL